MNTSPPSPPQRGDATRDALVAAALQIFARDGYHAASTRAIAELAGVNQALIGYHFGGKENLYLAVFDYIVGQLQLRIGDAAEAIGEALSDHSELAAGDPRTLHAGYMALLQRLADGVLTIMATEESTAWAQLILREQQAPTAAFDRVYENFMGRLMGLLGQLVGRIRGTDPDDPDTRMMVVTLLGQLMVFRAARAGVMRHLGWQAIGPDELQAIRQRVHDNLQLLLPFRD